MMYSCCNRFALDMNRMDDWFCVCVYISVKESWSSLSIHRRKYSCSNRNWIFSQLFRKVFFLLGDNRGTFQMISLLFSLGSHSLGPQYPHLWQHRVRMLRSAKFLTRNMKLKWNLRTISSSNIKNKSPTPLTLQMMKCFSEPPSNLKVRLASAHFLSSELPIRYIVWILVRCLLRNYLLYSLVCPRHSANPS